MAELFITVIIIIIFVLLIKRWNNQIGIRKAGKRGEEIADDVIRSVLTSDDHLLSNIEITYKGKRAEMDNVIVNSYGVFIIEVKNYKGILYGGEDDFEWTKFKMTGAGKTFEKSVKNPIRQVKRQTNILSNYLNSKGFRVRVEGKALLLDRNSPVASPYILSNVDEISRVLHTFRGNHLDSGSINAICRLLLSKSRKKFLF